VAQPIWYTVGIYLVLVVIKIPRVLGSLLEDRYTSSDGMYVSKCVYAAYKLPNIIALLLKITLVPRLNHLNRTLSINTTECKCHRRYFRALLQL